MSDDISQDVPVYCASHTGSLFHGSDDYFRGVMGPVGSGKTVMGVTEIYMRAFEQQPWNGVRRTRWALIRNTYPELLSTTLKTWEDWVPREICRISKASPISGVLEAEAPDGTRVEAEVFFLALDTDDDVKKLKSLELTGAFLNEASEIKKSVLDMATTRVGRYPPARWGGPTWHGVFADTNPPDDQHWWYHLAEVEKPKGFRFFRQPPGLFKVAAEKKGDPPLWVPNDGSYGFPAAENIANLPGGYDYYLRMVAGKDPEWINVYALGNYGMVVSGRPVYSEYSDQIHLAKEPLKAYGGLPLLLAFDFGLTPACVVMQQIPKNGQVRVLHEFTSEDMGIDRFVRDVVRPQLTATYGNRELLSVGDPAGGQRSQADETSCFDILRRHGIPAEPAPSNSFMLRREAVAWFLTKLSDGEPGFLLDPSCKTLRKGFISGYHYRKMKIGGAEGRYAETPEKNSYSHPHDALQYGCSYLRQGYMDVATFADTGGARQVVISNSKGWT